jgi:uncharacterized protein (DUF1015 family)
MARFLPFRPYRYSAAAGPLEALVTQPYDKISPAMRSRYLSLSPYNLVRLVLDEPREADTAADNVYTRAAARLDQWIAGGVLVQDPEPSFFAYFQRFADPDTGETLTRRGVAGLGELSPYSAGIVHRHEQTLTGPKRDRMELLRHTRAQCELLFLVYQDPECTVDRLLDEAAAGPPDAEVRDEYGAEHRLWRIGDGARAGEIRRLIAARKLIIADGHHRYETALAFHEANPGLAGAAFVPMTLFNTHSPGLRILATHRVLHGVAPEALERGKKALEARFATGPVDAAGLKAAFAVARPDRVRIGVAFPEGMRLLEADREAGELDVAFLHRRVLAECFGVGEEAVREERAIRYARGIDTALAMLAEPGAQAAFLLEPTRLEQVAAVSFSGGVMPQKSTDFYPKLLSGLTIYRMER